jgi:HEAT repeat protein
MDHENMSALIPPPPDPIGRLGPAWRERLHQAKSRLDDREESALSLIYLMESPPEEVSALLECSIDEVQASLRSALNRLAKHSSEWGRVTLTEAEVETLLKADGDLERAEMAVPLSAEEQEHCAMVVFQAFRRAGVDLDHAYGPEALLYLLRDEDPQVRLGALARVGQISTPTASFLAPLAHLLQDQDRDVCLAALEAVGALGAAAATAPILAHLAHLLQDQNEYVRRAAAEAIGQLGASAPTASFLAGLRARLRDWVAEVRLAAARALEQVGHGLDLNRQRLADLLGLEIDAAFRLAVVPGNALPLQLQAAPQEGLRTRGGPISEPQLPSIRSPWIPTEDGRVQGRLEVEGRLVRLYLQSTDPEMARQSVRFWLVSQQQGAVLAEGVLPLEPWMEGLWAAMYEVTRLTSEHFQEGFDLVFDPVPPVA